MKVKHLVGAFLCVLGCYACSSPKTAVSYTHLTLPTIA